MLGMFGAGLCCDTSLATGRSSSLLVPEVQNLLSSARVHTPTCLPESSYDRDHTNDA